MKDISNLLNTIITYRGIYDNITINENTLDSIKYSIKNNLCTMIDIKKTKDGEIILFSSDTMEKINIKEKIDTITYEDLIYLSKYDIPKLKDILELIKDKAIIININIDIKKIKTNLLNILNKYKDKVIINSKYIDIVKYFKKNKYYTGYIVEDPKDKLLKKNINTDILLLKYDEYDIKTIKELKKTYYVIGYILDNRMDVEKYIKVFNNLVIDNIEEVFK